jgi:glycosyltransferase involved in cell wall biosynthesis
LSERTASLPAEDLLEIALAAARFPRQAPGGGGFGIADIDRIAHRFPGFLAGRLDGFGAGAAGKAGAVAGFNAALTRWGRHRFEGAGEGPEALAQRIGITFAAGTLAAAALPALAELRRRDLANLAALDAPGPGAVPLSRLFRLLLFAIRLRRPDMLGLVDASLAAVFDWVVVFGLTEQGLWHLLPPADRRLLLAGTPKDPPVFLRAVMRFRPDLRALADRPERLRDWFRACAVAEYGIRLAEPERDPPRPGLLSVIGPWKQVLGISDDCFSACRALDALGCDYEVAGTKPARWIETDPDKLAALRHRAVEMPGGDRAFFCDTLFEATFWALRHWPRFASFRRVDLFAPWELPGLPPGWQAAARMFDTILSPSDFARQAFVASGAERALAVTSSVEVIGRPAPASALMLRRRLALPAGRRVFVCVFDFSSYLARKNPEAVVRAFAALRRQVPNATLVLKTTRGRRARDAARRLRALLRGVPDVVWVDGAWPNAMVEALLRRADALVSLHRSEGFGRNIAKTLLLGRPVVVTDWSGNADMRAEPGYFGVPCRLKPLTDRDYVLGGGQVWAEPDPRGAVRQMRAALGFRQRVERPRTGLRFSRQRLARRLGRALELG